MSSAIPQLIEGLRSQVRSLPAVKRLGRVTGVTGLIIESEGPNVGLGELCKMRSDRSEFDCLAQVVGFRGQHVLLMPLGEMTGLHAGTEVIACDLPPLPTPGPHLLGRVLDALGRPMDGLGAVATQRGDATASKPPHPLRRQRISQPFVTGVRAIDAFIPLGRGQRVGLFAGSGVGKSTLLSMIARGADADVVVVGLVGERGRELREFLEKDLGDEGRARSVVVCSTSDTSAPLRMRAAYTATSIAEAYRDAGANVLLLMDSVTRFAMAQREIGLAVGEPPATRGYTPSVFALLPRLLERAGSGEQGTITAIYTVLVEGDDMNEPVADAVRGILDGHIVLSRALAHANHYPAIDVLESVSRLTRDVCSPEDVTSAGLAREHLAVYKKNEDLITIGAYQKGANAALDQAVALHDPLRDFLRQGVHDRSERAPSFAHLKEDRWLIRVAMKRFRFPLKSLLVVREARDLRAREIFGAALQAVVAVERTLEMIRHEKSEFEQVMLAERRGSFRPADQAAFLQAHRRLIVRETETVASLAQVKVTCETRRREWLEARRALRLIEKLESNALQAHRIAEDREAQLMLDDRTNALAARDAANAA